MKHEEKVSSFWDFRSKTYDSFVRLPLYRKFIDGRDDAIWNFLDLTEDDVVFEPGCGTGYFTIPMSKKVREVQSCDISDGMIKLLKKKVNEIGIDNVQIKKCSVQEFNSNEKFDKIVFVNVLNYIKDDVQPIFDKFYSMLKPGGCLVINAPDKRRFFSWTYYLKSILMSLPVKLYHQKEVIENLKKSGYVDIEVDDSQKYSYYTAFRGFKPR